MKKILIIGCIMLFLGGFVSKEVAEYKAVQYMEEMNSKIPYEVQITRHRVWSRVNGFGRYDVFIDYNANNLRLTTMYVVKGGSVIDCYRVSE